MRLEHRHLAHLLDAGISEDGQPDLALSYVEGEPSTDYCRCHGLSLQARLQLIVQMCAAVDHAHISNLVVHRYLKLSNMLVSARGQACVLDFGIAQLPSKIAFAGPDAMRGKRSFASHCAVPEQVRGEVITTLTAVYSLGSVLHEVSSGEKPHWLRRQNDAQWDTAILALQPIKPSLAIQHAADAGTYDKSDARI